jgi:hypothetical protein
MTKDAIRKRFGKKPANEVPFANRSDKVKNNPQDDGEKFNPWARADVWEIWDKESGTVLWWVEGYPEILDEKEDTLELDGFFPSPKPMFANLTTSKLLPTPDYTLAQDIYDEIDLVSTRITLLERAVAVRGVYDKSSPEIARLLEEAGGNQLIPTDGFAAFKERGGLQGVVDWLPLDQIVGALDTLRQYRTELMGLLFQVTGMSDIMRGQAEDKNVTATEQSIKAKFASTRVQEFQNEFARFASDLQAIKAEIISKHFDPKTIWEQSNAQYMTGMDPQIAQQAVGLIKSNFWEYRIEVKPESVALADMTAVKQERSEFLMAVATFMQSAQPIIQGAPWSAKYLLQMLQWSMAGFRGGSTIEGVLDQMVIEADQAQKQAAQQPPPPDPKMMQIQAKAQTDQAKAQNDMQIAQQKNAMEMAKMKLEMQMDMQRMTLELEAMKAKLGMEQQAQAIDLGAKQQGAALDAQKAEMEMRNEAVSMTLNQQNQQVEHDLAMQREHEKHQQSMQQMKEQAKARPPIIHKKGQRP